MDRGAKSSVLYLLVRNSGGGQKNDVAGLRERLEALRLALLSLHKELVDSERVQYEKTMGRIGSPGQFLQLLTNDPWFAWLSPLSRLIVSIDEALDAPEPVTPSLLDGVMKQSAKLLVATETGSGFSKHYDEALQRDPDVVMAHAEVVKQLRAGVRLS